MNPRALVADDDAAVRRVLCRLLGRAGLSTDEAHDGEQAVRLATNCLYQLILLDAQMPHLGGIEAARAIRGAGEVLSSVPIFLLTGALTDEVSAAATAAGIDGCLCKPVTLSEIESLVARVLTAQPRQESTPRDALEPAFQPAVLLDAAGGDATALAELVSLFISQATSVFAELRFAVSKGEPAQLKKSVHKLRGTTAMVGAGRLAALVTSVGAAPSEQTLSEVERELARVISAMKAICSTS